MHTLAFFAGNNDLTPGQTAAVVAAALTFGLILLAVGIAIHIVICALLYGCFTRIPPQFRKMEPGLVWLLLIPLVPLVWNFFVYQRLPESFQAYFGSVGRTDVGDCGRGIGMAYSICYIGALVPCINYVAGPAALVLLIIFLVKVIGLKNQIALAPPH